MQKIWPKLKQMYKKVEDRLVQNEDLDHAEQKTQNRVAERDRLQGEI